MEKIVVVLNEPVKKKDFGVFGGLALDKHYLDKKRGTSNVFIYHVAFDDMRKSSTIINSLKRDLKANGYTQFTLI